MVDSFLYDFWNKKVLSKMCMLLFYYLKIRKQDWHEFLNVEISLSSSTVYESCILEWYDSVIKSREFRLIYYYVFSLICLLPTCTSWIIILHKYSTRFFSDILLLVSLTLFILKIKILMKVNLYLIRFSLIKKLYLDYRNSIELWSLVSALTHIFYLKTSLLQESRI